jgi:deoxyribose-phosphate aldolase
MTSPEQLIAVLDLTTLKGDETEADIAALCERAAEHGVAAVCVYGEWVQACVRHLDGTPVRVATVANFPQGQPDRTRSTWSSHGVPGSPVRARRWRSSAPPAASARGRSR